MFSYNLSNKDSNLLKYVESLFFKTVAEEYLRHIHRVIGYAIFLGKKENVNLKILIPAAILHDVGRCISSDLSGHVQKGTFLAELLLSNNNYHDDKCLILDTIGDHHNDLTKNIPRNIEGEVLLDADRIEITGSIGLARWFKSFNPNTPLEKAAELFILFSKQRRPDRNSFFSTMRARPKRGAA